MYVRQELFLVPDSVPHRFLIWCVGVAAEYVYEKGSHVLPSLHANPKKGTAVMLLRDVYRKVFTFLS